MQVINQSFDNSDVLLLALNIDDVDDAVLSAIQGFLKPDEKARLERFNFLKDRKRYAAARLLQYVGFASLLKRNPDDLELVTGKHGKPQLKLSSEQNPGSEQSGSTLEFNLSHSGSWAVAAFSGGRVGIDVENCHRKNDVLAIANHYFYAQELSDMFAEEGKERDNFFNLWTLKESYMKARGEGLSLGLDNFGFVRDYGSRSGYRLVCSEKLADDGENWWFNTISPDMEHRLSMVLDRRSVRAAGQNDVCISSFKCSPLALGEKPGLGFEDLISLLRWERVDWF